MQLPSKKSLAVILTPNSYRTSAAPSTSKFYQQTSINALKNNSSDQNLPKTNFLESSLSPKSKFIRPSNNRFFNGIRNKEFSENEIDPSNQTLNNHTNSASGFLADLKMTPTSQNRVQNVNYSQRNLAIRSKAPSEISKSTELSSKDLVTPKMGGNSHQKSHDSSHPPLNINILSTEQGILPKIDNLQKKEKPERQQKNLVVNTDFPGIRNPINISQDHKLNFMTPKEVVTNASGLPENTHSLEVTAEEISFKKNFHIKSHFSARTKINKNALLQPIKDNKTDQNDKSSDSTPKLITKVPNKANAFRHLIFSPHIDKNVFKKHLMLVHSGLIYSIQFLRGPSDKFLESKQINLGDPSLGIVSNLDETLIKSCPGAVDYDKIVYATKDGQTFQIPFKIRPYVDAFLKKMKNYYEIVIFTASVRHYAEAIIEEIDPEGIITYILDRTYCLETKNGYAIKDLRIIKNRELKNMVIVDNLVHSFGLQIENGIPILEWNGEKEDAELKYLADYLVEASYVEDIREYNKQNLKLREFASASLANVMLHT